MRAAARTCFAPATVSNLGPGFDLLGLAIEGIGDTVTARLTSEPGVTVERIFGDNGRLSLLPAENTAAIAATSTLRLAHRTEGIALTIHKGMPLGSGLGSSAASAAAAALAVNLLLGSPLKRSELVAAVLDAEEAVSGRHADNAAPALLGGLVLVRSLDPIDILRLPIPPDLFVAVVTPDCEVSTRAARELLPKQIPLRARTENAANIASFVAACYTRDLGLLAASIVDTVVTTPRLGLIPGGAEALDAAQAAGALASSISGSGPSLFALCHTRATAQRAATAMVAAFAANNLAAKPVISPADGRGAREVQDPLA